MEDYYLLFSFYVSLVKLDTLPRPLPWLIPADGGAYFWLGALGATALPLKYLPTCVIVGLNANYRQQVIM